MINIDYETYSAKHNKVTEDEYNIYFNKAMMEVKAVIGAIHFEEITADTFGYNELIDCICNMIDMLKDDSITGKGKGLSSISNDGYMETINVRSNAELSDDYRSAIRRWLSGTGLVRAY